MSIAPTAAVASEPRHPAAARRRRRAIGLVGVGIAVALLGCRGDGPDRAPSPSPSPSPVADATATASPARVALVSELLVPGPVRDRLERADGTIVLARGAELWIVRLAEDAGEPVLRRVAAGSPAPLLALVEHDGAVHAAGRDGRVWRLEEGRDGRGLIALPEAASASNAAGDADADADADADGGRSGRGPGAVDERAVGLSSLGGALHLVHGDRVLTWTDPSAAPDVTALPSGSGGPADPHVVPGERGPLVATGRRVHAVGDGGFAGSASRLRAAPPGADWPGRLLFARLDVDGRGAEVGAMDGRLRELDRDRLRLRLDAPVTALAFHRGEPVVATPGRVLRLAVEDGRLVTATSGPLVPGERLWAVGPDRAAILGPDGRRRSLPGVPPAPDPLAALALGAAGEGPGASRLPSPLGATFDGRTLRVRTDAGVHDVGPDGRVRERPDLAEPPPDAIRVRSAVATRRGALAVPPDGRPGLVAGPAALAIARAGGVAPAEFDAAIVLPDIGPVAGLAAVEGRAWVAVEGRLLLVDPAGPEVVAGLPVDGVPAWIALADGGRTTIVLTDAGEVRRVRVDAVD